VFLINNRLDDFGQTIDDVFFFFTERGLIRNLKKIAHGLGAFAVKAAHREPDFADRLDDLVDQSLRTSPGRCSIAEARMPVPTFVGQAVKYPSRGSKAKSSLLSSAVSILIDQLEACFN
jgi:hypothetical protein